MSDRPLATAENDAPFVAVGNGEDPPWGNDRACPVCGEPDLPLLDSVPPGLTYVKHCGQAWLRGAIRVIPPAEGNADPAPGPTTEGNDRERRVS